LQKEQGFQSGCDVTSGMTNLGTKIFLIISGFVRVLENLESPWILLWYFPGLESPGKGPLVLESAGNLLNSSKKKYEMYGRE